MNNLNHKTIESIVPADRSFKREDVEFVLEQIVSKKIDLTTNYHDWVKIGFAFAREFGEDGRSYYHMVSRNYVRQGGMR